MILLRTKRPLVKRISLLGIFFSNLLWASNNCLHLLHFTPISYYGFPFKLTYVPPTKKQLFEHDLSFVNPNRLFLFLDASELFQVSMLFAKSTTPVSMLQMKSLFERYRGTIPISELLPNHISADLNKRSCTSPENCFAAAVSFHNPQLRRVYLPDVDMIDILSKNYDELPEGAIIKMGDLLTFWLGSENSGIIREPSNLEAWKLLHAGVYLDDQFMFNKTSFLNGEGYKIQSFASAIQPYLSASPVVRVFRKKEVPKEEPRIISP